jgi:uncharacterized protein YydD (DUF2326 family)
VEPLFKPLRKILLNKIREFFDNYNAKTEELKNFKLDVNFIKNKLKDYPKLNELISNLQNLKDNSQ